MMAINFLTPNFLTPLNLEQIQASKILNQKPAEEIAGTSQLSFADMLKKSMEDVSVTNAQTEIDIVSLVTGMASDNLHNIEIEAVKADLALRTMVSVRNKILDAYTEVMRITV